MVNFFKPAITNRLVASLTLIALTTAVITPSPVYAAGVNLDLETINFGIKVEKIFEKIKKCIDKGETNKIVSYMLDLKGEVEQYSGQKIDINKAIDRAQREARAKGTKIDDKYIKAIKKEFGHQDKKHKHRATWFAQCAEIDMPYTQFEADYNFDMNFMMARAAANHKHEKKEDVPITIMVGVTVSLCGLFLCFVPLPGCQTAGGWLLSSGVSILSGDAIKRWDEYDQDQRKKR